ncbi:SpvB/TcaC N-terminal domain-containing protein [Hamadaea tsunoensis]|uniref:SpvB/TcaC N-terminal domain-containing protein n=1 Tax=Hamadaea tsunoensis TaxID=53368 RepID=UPI00040E887A|nr:SpvB/TcaC N-terminal domain-containing protein [Hamadaea tsunoensis]
MRRTWTANSSFQLIAAGLGVALVAAGLVASGPPPTTHRAAPAMVPAAADSCGDATGTGATTASVPAPTVPDHEEMVGPAEPLTHVVAWGGAQVAIKPGALAKATGIGISGLPATDLAPMDGGMTDVTGKARPGFRFTPHPLQFLKDVEVTLPYDPALVPDDFTASDLYTYFYDDVAHCWQVLQRESVDETAHTVTSLTSHFTDFVNATVTAPESPQNVSFNPTQIKGLQVADPAAQVRLINPPTADSRGDNRLSYPIETPPGRHGVQPTLAVSYSSAGGDGWLGLGWDLTLPGVFVDTRWGVPRYDTATETETYLLNGQQLNPVTYRGPAVARTAEKVFHPRVEGSFARIVRHGADPKSYTWEVTDKTGVRSLYGGAGATLTDNDGNVYQWALREVRDPHGNVMTFTYAQVDDTGLDGGTEPGRNLYPKKITYTGTGTTPGRYAVTFVRDRELNEPLRADKSIDARGGFKRVTADRLRRVDVTLDATVVRRYEFAYTQGAFDKTLLKSVTQLDGAGTVFTRHDFAYFDDIRDAHGDYQAFKSADWTVPGDGLSQTAVDITDDDAGDASALNAGKSTSAGGHLYVGVGESPSKSGTVGLKTGFQHTSDEGVLALVDVDGDNLPDKVFRDGGTVRYRKNLSGPHGQPRFADEAKTLNLPSIQGSSSNTLTLGVEAYPGAAALQLDYVNTFVTEDTYFSDVNGDGIVDLVNGSSVLFGRVGANGVPVYGVSADTPVPVASGAVDTTGLLGDLAPDRERMADSYPLLDTVRRWVAPYAGVVRVDGTVTLQSGGAGDGVRVAVQHEGTELWSDTIEAADSSPHTPSNMDAVTVAAGDRLYFRVQSRDDGSHDEVAWDPVITYQGVPATTDVNGLDAYRFQASGDFTLGGRIVTVKAPLTGTLHLSGDLHKNAATTDDVTALITRDGTPVLQQTLPGGSAGTVAVNLDVNVQKGQTLAWRVQVDSPIDASRIAWVPRAFYTAADGVDRLTDPQGNPIIDVFPPYDVDLYPVDGLTSPQTPLGVVPDGDVTVSPALTFDFGDTKPDDRPSGRIVFTVKRRGELVAKSVFTVDKGVLTSPGTLTVHPVATGGAQDELYFDFSTTEPKLRPFLTGQSAHVVHQNGTSQDGQSVFHSTAEEGAFPQAYRGWGGVGYNGNKDRAGQPIVQDDLVIDKNYGGQLPSTVDPQAQKDAFGQDPKVDPPKVVPFFPAPDHDRWGVGEHSFVTRTGAASSRLGTESIQLPSTSDFAGTAVSRLSRSQQISLTGSVGGGSGSLGGSLATGDSVGQVDFLDLNGDQFPDVVSGNGIQYTDPTGGLGGKRGTLPDGAVRSSSTESGNASAGSAARTIQTGAGNAGPTGETPATTAHAGNDLPPFGVGANLGGSRSHIAFDLLDVNGDGLPDRVYADGKVALNLGYRFGAAEQWRNPAPVNEGSGTDLGANLGFNTDFYGFAGGAAFERDVSGVASTLLDVNGDGLADRVFAGDPIMVGINTGNGFDAPVAFHGSLSGLTRDQNASASAGAYFTFGICFIVVCVVINPGASASLGASRTEQALRDVNGDGFADHVASVKDDRLVVAENQTGRTNLLKTVTRPLGGHMDFDYTRDGNTYGQPQSKFVLSKVAVDDGHPGDGADVSLLTFEYSGGHYDRLEREFDGYATVVERHRDPDGGAVGRSITYEYRNDGPYTHGLPTRTTTTDAAGHKFLQTESTYALRDVDHPDATADPHSPTATIFPQLVRTDSRFYEGQTDPGESTFTTMEYDALGNVTRTFDAGEPGTSDDLETRTGYADCPASGITGIADDVQVTGGGTTMRKRESTVDCATGDVTQIRSKLANGDTAVSDLEYFANGNLKAVTTPPNKNGQRFRTDYGYDGVVDTYVESVTDSFGYHSTSTHDLRFGSPATSTDINHQPIVNTYDSFGRLISVAGPYEQPEGRVTASFEYHPEAPVPYAVTRHIDRQADGVHADTIDTIAFADGLGRTIQTKTDAAVATGPDTPPANVMVVTGKAVYDFLGRIVQQSYPVTEPKGAANTAFNASVDPVAPVAQTFDVLDRPTRTVLPDGTVSTQSYGFGADRSGANRFEETATDANGKSQRTYTDVRKQVTTVKEFNPAGGQPVILTSYGYDALGQQTSIVDDHNNATTTAYDNFGRVVSVVSPDTGRTDTVYDLAGNLTRRITANLAAQSKAVEYDYDYNRISGIRYPVFTANNVTYTYGGPGAANNGADRVVSIVDGAGTLTREYGPLGETTKESRTVAGQAGHLSTFTTQYRYDTWNRVLTLTYPDSEVLTYHYDSGGYVDTATGLKGGHTYAYLTRLDYDKFGDRVLLDTGNGTRTRTTFDPQTRRLDTLKANIAQGYVFENFRYTYDNVGNILQIKNDTVAPTDSDVGQKVGGPSTETFRYDDLYRLVHAEGSYTPRGTKTDKYQLDETYDSISNLTGKTQVHQFVSNGNTQTDNKLTYDFDYGYAAAQPHAPTAIGTDAYAYDADGNQISRNIQGNQPRQMVWDEENRLACSNSRGDHAPLPQTPAGCDNPGGQPDARFRYDDQGNRIVKDGSAFHFYPNQNYSTDGNHEFKHIFVGDTKLLTKTVDKNLNKVEDQQFYSHDDHLGSTGFITDADGRLAEHLQYMAGGETWVDEHPSQPVPQQYTGKELDPETGLYYYGARYYDPRTSVWQSADPALPSAAPGSRDLSAYLYARGNPVRYNDPDGRSPAFGAPSGATGRAAVEWHPTQPHNHLPGAANWAGVQQVLESKQGFYENYCRDRSFDRVSHLTLGHSEDEPLAHDHLQHYLTGQGSTLVEDANLDRLLRDDHEIAYWVEKSIVKGVTAAGTQKTGLIAGHLRIDQQDYTIAEFKNSFGAIDQVDWSYNLDTGKVQVWFQDRYEWHPVYKGLYDRFADDDVRETNCIHAALVEMKSQGAEDYWMQGFTELSRKDLQQSADGWDHKRGTQVNSSK